MRSLWNVVSFLAIANLLALAFFGTWLWQSDRLSVQRVRQVRELFAQTTAHQRAEDEKRKAEDDAAKQAQLEAKRAANPPSDSAAQLREISLISQEHEQVRRRLQDERAMLLAQLQAESARIDAQKVELQQQREQWENAVSADRKRKNDEQFLQTVKQLEQLPPKQGKQMIIELIEGDQLATAVAYLDSMNARSAGKILKEFKSEPEIKLATKLLERLRTFGLESSKAAPVSGAASAPASKQDTSDADGLASAR